MVELTYLLKYTETRNSAEEKADWSVRQIGVYHRYDPRAMQNTWIILFPTADSSTQRDLVNEVSSTCNMEQTAYHPLSLHMSLIQARIHNWRLCVSQFEDKVWELVRLPHSFKISWLIGTGKSCVHRRFRKHLAVPRCLQRHLRPPLHRDKTCNTTSYLRCPAGTRWPAEYS
jgi:hypothetical protein